MHFKAFAGNMYVGTLRVTKSGHHRFRDREGYVISSEHLNRYKCLNLRRY